MWWRRNFWKVLQAAASLATLVVILASPSFWRDAANPAAAETNPVMLVFFGPLFAAVCVFVVSYIAELIWSDVRAWRLRNKRSETGLVDPLSLDRVKMLVDEHSGDALKVLERPTHRKSLEKRQ